MLRHSRSRPSGSNSHDDKTRQNPFGVLVFVESSAVAEALLTVQLCSHTCSQTFPAHQIHSAFQFRKTSVTYRRHVLPLRA